MWAEITNRWNWVVFSSRSCGSRCASVVFVQRLIEWRFFNFWYQPSEALNCSSLHNCLALSRKREARSSLSSIALTCFGKIWPIRRGRSHDYVFRRFPILILRKLWSFKGNCLGIFHWQSWIHNYSKRRCAAVLWNVSNWFPRFIMNLNAYWESVQEGTRQAWHMPSHRFLSNFHRWLSRESKVVWAPG